jgi:hypothetical protein
MRKGCSILIILVFTVILSSSPVQNNSANFEEKVEKMQRYTRISGTKFDQISSLNQYITHKPILISNDTDFHNKAITEGWDLNKSRDGTLIAPYVISGYKIESNDSRLIEVQNTTVNFELRDNLIRTIRE